MSHPESDGQWGGEPDHQAGLAVQSYEAYMYLGHSVFHPEHYLVGLKAFHDDPEIVAVEYERWQFMPVEAIRKFFVNQAIWTLRQAQSETGVAYELPKDDTPARVGELQDYLVNHVGVRGKELALSSDWAQNDISINKFANPFSNTALLTELWRYSGDRILTPRLGRVATLLALLPSYWGVKSYNRPRFRS